MYFINIIVIDMSKNATIFLTMSQDLSYHITCEATHRSLIRNYIT